MRLGSEDQAPGWTTRPGPRPTVKRSFAVDKLVEDIRRDPFAGSAKPEPLKYHLPGAWSRRIDEEHRLVYIVPDKEIIIIAARYHYVSDTSGFAGQATRSGIPYGKKVRKAPELTVGGSRGGELLDDGLLGGGLVGGGLVVDPVAGVTSASTQ